jgi:hypothetical protein
MLAAEQLAGEQVELLEFPEERGVENERRVGGFQIAAKMG